MEVADTKSPAQQSPDPPFGAQSARVDDKGRLKLPVCFSRFLTSFGTNRVFITSLDERTLRIYPISVWKRNLEVLKNFKGNPRVAADVAFIANANGADSEIDEQHRVLLPQEIRRALGMENATVYVDCYNNRVNVYGADMFEQRRQEARQDLASKVLAVEEQGFE